jgi:hypothetical protein
MSGLGALPFAPYHWLLYGESLWFDSSRAKDELGWAPTYSNGEMLIESYEWFLAHQDEIAEGKGSHHKSPVRLGALKLLKRWP